MRLFPIALLASIWSIPAFAEDSCGFLHKQTQAFSDAGQRGDGLAMAKMLDPGVIFFNETGEESDPRRHGECHTAGRRSTESHDHDYGLELQGIRRCGGDELHRCGGARKAQRGEIPISRDLEKGGRCLEMIGSETLTLQQDPDAVVIAAEALDEYVGSYEGGGSMKFQLRTQGRRARSVSQRWCGDGAEGAGPRHLLHAGTRNDA